MPTLQTKHLTGRALDYAVAVAEGGTDFLFDGITWGFKLGGATKVLAKGWSPSMSYSPSTDWSQGGPIIEREKINLETRDDPDGFYWVALVPNHRGDGPTALIAAMRCFVASKLGPTVDIPKDLLTNQGAS